MSIDQQMRDIGKKSIKASEKIKQTSTETKNNLLLKIAGQLEKDKQLIIIANQKDLSNAKSSISSSMIDRLMLNEERIESIINSVNQVVKLHDPTGIILNSNTRPNGMIVERISVPLGVIGIIYESRPNVTVDASVLCLKAGNSVILRGGKESYFSNLQLVNSMQMAIEELGLDKNIIQFIETTDRTAVDIMLSDMVDYIDVVIPRGGKGLVKKVQEKARVPVIGHLDGICHLYIDEFADIDKAVAISENSKLRRTGICGAAETLLIHKKCINTHLPHIVEKLKSGGCEIRVDEECQKLFPEALLAIEEDWQTEYLEAKISIKVVDDLYHAIQHIKFYGSKHTESIITENSNNAEIFLDQVDSAIVMHNTSTQFADGGEFGLGAEIGIATGKIHARGPVGLDGLTTYKYIVKGNGQIRP